MYHEVQLNNKSLQTNSQKPKIPTYDAFLSDKTLAAVMDMSKKKKKSCCTAQETNQKNFT